MRVLLQKAAANLHYAGTVLLAVSAIPAIQHLHLPTRLNWVRILEFYWITLGPRSMLYALVFCIVALPVRETLGPFWSRYKKEKLRFVFVLLFLLVLQQALWLTIAIVLTVDSVFVVELAERCRSNGSSFRKTGIAVLISTTYMLAGLTLVTIYNDIIVASKFPVSYDAVLNRMDTWILGGRTVPVIAHKMLAILPRQLLRFLDFAYFQMFLLVGAALLIAAFDSCMRGLQFVGTCLTAHYLTLLTFYLWPTYGPYLFCSTHAAQLPVYLSSYAFQISGMPHLQALMRRQIQYLGTGYYIAFPSMHIALPLIAMWYLRNWRRVFWLLGAYCCVLVFAIVALEWHYALDLPGGIAVAVIALMLSGPSNKAVREGPESPNYQGHSIAATTR